MKKLKLKNLKLEANDLLKKEQLKVVFGGYGGYEIECGSYYVVVDGESRWFDPDQGSLAQAYSDAWNSLGHPNFVEQWTCQDF